LAEEYLAAMTPPVDDGWVVTAVEQQDRMGYLVGD
jgi:hypothetical protein